jgi:DNA-binding beta-propeller fold protein YncE
MSHPPKKSEFAMLAPLIRPAAAAIARVAALLAVASTSSCTRADTQVSLDDPRSPLHLVRSIPLPGVHGRIDHMAFDGDDNRLFVAEYGNGSVDEIDLTTGRIIGRINGLHEPQGVMWMPKQREIAISCGDGSVRFYRETDRAEVARVQLGDDADNLRLDPRNGDLVVGYGSGGLAVIEPAAHRLSHEVRFSAHPEAFALLGSRVFVNLPGAHEIAVADLDQAHVITTLSTGMRAGNFPIAIDPTGSRVAVAFRLPGTVSVFDVASGTPVYSVPICGDADDLYFHGSHLVVVCGEGAVELVEQGGAHTEVRVTTKRGARTGLLLAERNELLIAVPGQEGGGAIWQLAVR